MIIITLKLINTDKKNIIHMKMVPLYRQQDALYTFSIFIKVVHINVNNHCFISICGFSEKSDIFEVTLKL